MSDSLRPPWTVAHQAPQSMEFSRQDYWSGLPFPSPADLPNPGIEAGSPALQAGALPSEPPGASDCQKLPLGVYTSGCDEVTGTRLVLPQCTYVC